ncbi:MAG: dephospho-CoA kinase [Micavibrio aeruginosavorus]|uniref:Dephospho-CoA kinase n=1 Tax=Micavibrio aeruginosavorus TaxID=349221 RepID=A0A2W4ZL14_9BACT|nr:MAG: dephospho-CoA kinase [Micavibrio aeruginosavorus]
MIVIGLTGSIGMGKSRAASMLKLMGIPVHDSDKAVHAALQPKGIAFDDVVSAFPSALDKKTNGIDRKKLGDIVFNDPAALKTLENILHPAAKKSQVDFIQAMTRKGKRAAVLEIPLLFETGAEKRVDCVICVSAPPAIQRRRVLARKGMTEEKFKSILAKQMPDAQKRSLSDYVVQTGMGPAHTFRALRKIVRELGV